MTGTWSGLMHFLTKTVRCLWSGWPQCGQPPEMFSWWSLVSGINISIFLQGCDVCCKTVILLYSFCLYSYTLMLASKFQWQCDEQPEEVSVVQCLALAKHSSSLQGNDHCVKLCKILRSVSVALKCTYI